MQSNEKADLENKIGGAFGAHGWSTEAQERIYQTMKTVFKMEGKATVDDNLVAEAELMAMVGNKEE